jgi:hypothetical protein
VSVSVGCPVLEPFDGGLGPGWQVGSGDNIFLFFVTLCAVSCHKI